MAQVELTVNGVARRVEPEDGETLLQTLRERLELVAAKVGCSQGYCGARCCSTARRRWRACSRLPGSPDGGW